MIEEQHWSNRRILTLLAAGTLIVSLIWHAPQEAAYISERTGELMLTLVLAMSLTYLLRPCVNALHRSRAFGGTDSRSGRMWATLTVFLGIILLIWLFFLLGLKPIVADVRQLAEPFFQLDAEERVAKINEWKASIKQALLPYQGVLPFQVHEIERSFPSWVSSGTVWLREKLSHSFSPSFIVELILVPVLVFYFLTDGKAIRQEARLLSPPSWRGPGARILDELDRVSDGYIRGQMWMCIIAWALVTIGLLILGVPYAFTLGLLAGITRAVPVIGPLLGGAPIALVCLVTTKSINTTLILLVGFTLMHFLESKVLLPKIVGHEVDLHPVSVIISLLIGMEFFGFIGVFLAVPIAAVLKGILAEWHRARVEEQEADQSTLDDTDLSRVEFATPETLRISPQSSQP
jgi:predicted PurR-regulated permease PerM